jgi:hypothetical protein
MSSVTDYTLPVEIPGISYFDLSILNRTRIYIYGWNHIVPYLWTAQ